MFTMMSLQIVFFIIYLVKRLKPIRNFMYIFIPFDPNTDPLNPPPKTKQKLKPLFDIIKEENNTNENKKEKEIKKTILINNLLGNNKEKKGNKRKNKKIKDKEKEDDIIIEFINNEDDQKDGKEYTRNKTSKNHEFKGKTRIISVDKKNNKFNNDKSNLTNKTNMYETFSKQNEYNNINNFPNKYETKPKKNQIIFTNIFSPIIDIKNNKDSSNINNIISNSERENIYNSEAITNYGQSYNNSKKAKLKLMNNKIKFKSGKYKIQNKIGKTKDKENTIEETGTNLNMEEKSKKIK